MKMLWNKIMSVLFGPTKVDIKEFEKEFEKRFPDKDIRKSFEEYGRREGFIS